MRSRSAWLSACSAALLLIGCGSDGESQLPLAEQLAARGRELAPRLGSEGDCRAAAEAGNLLGEAIDAVNRGRIEPEAQEDLIGELNALVASARCKRATPP